MPEALQHLPGLNEGARLFNCLFWVSAFLSAERYEKIGA